MLSKIKSLGWSSTIFAGFAGVIIYCCFTFASILLFPGPFSAFEYHLSKLGNSSANPQGAIFYNVGIFITGVCLFFFYVGFYSWYTQDKPSRLLIVALLVSCFNATTLSLVGVFSEDVYALHVITSMLFFTSLLPTLALLGGFLFSQLAFERVIGVCGFLVTAIDVFFIVKVLTIGTSTGSIVEWVAVAAFISWTLLVTGNTLRRALATS